MVVTDDYQVKPFKTEQFEDRQVLKLQENVKELINQLLAKIENLEERIITLEP